MKKIQTIFINLNYKKQKTMKVKIKKLHPNAIIPTYAKYGDAGLDLTCVEIEETKDYIEYNTGLAIEIPYGYVGLMFPRSSVTKKDLILGNSVGVIDSGYRGKLVFRYKKILNMNNLEWSQGIGYTTYNIISDVTETYNVGERVGQILIVPYPEIELEEVSDLSESERGEGGFGSTNKK